MLDRLPVKISCGISMQWHGLLTPCTSSITALVMRTRHVGAATLPLLPGGRKHSAVDFNEAVVALQM